MDSAGLSWCRPRLGLLLNRRLGLPSCRPRRRSFSFLGLDQSQGIGSVEREFADRLLTRSTESYIHASIARQDDGPHVVEHPLPLGRSQLGILLNRIFHLGIGQVLFFPNRLGFEVGAGTPCSIRKCRVRSTRRSESA